MTDLSNIDKLWNKSEAGNKDFTYYTFTSTGFQDFIFVLNSPQGTRMFYFLILSNGCYFLPLPPFVAGHWNYHFRIRRTKYGLDVDFPWKPSIFYFWWGGVGGRGRWSSGPSFSFSSYRV